MPQTAPASPSSISATSSSPTPPRNTPIPDHDPLTFSRSICPMDPLKFGVVGVGGYGLHVIQQLLRHPDHARVAAVCDANPAMLQRHQDLIARAGARVMDSVQALLASDIEAVWLPLPIDLHRPFTEADRKSTRLNSSHANISYAV